MRWLLLFLLLIPFASSYAGFADPVGLSMVDTTVTATDDAIYFQGWYSANNQDWQSFTFPDAQTQGWILDGEASKTLPDVFTTGGEHYVLIYSCSKGSWANDDWQCYNNRWQIFKLEVSASSTKIIAVSSSSNQDANHLPELTLDSITSDNSYWAAEGDNSWVEYELSDVTPINFVEIAFHGDSSRHFELQTSLDGSSWSAVASEFTSQPNKPHQMQRFDFSSTQARYVRFLGHGSSVTGRDGWNVISEMNIADLEVDLSTQPCIPNNNQCGSDGCGDSHPVCSAGTCVNGVCDTTKNVIWQLDFEHRPLGTYQSMADFVEDWQPMENDWGNRGEDFKIVLDPDNPANKVGMFTYPHYDSSEFFYLCFHRDCFDDEKRAIKFEEEPTFSRGYLQNGVGPGGGGGQWTVDLENDYDEAYYSFRIRFGDNFDAVKGGKVPAGFYPYPRPCISEVTDCLYPDGINCHKTGCDESSFGPCKPVEEPCDGVADDFSAARLMFKSDHLSYYVSHVDQDPPTIPDSKSISNSGIVLDGEWHTIVGYARLNDPDEYNGVSRVWIDGVERNPWTGIMYRTGDRSLSIDSFKIGTIFGGGTYTRCGV